MKLLPRTFTVRLGPVAFATVTGKDGKTVGLYVGLIGQGMSPGELEDEADV